MSCQKHPHPNPECSAFENIRCDDCSEKVLKFNFYIHKPCASVICCICFDDYYHVTNPKCKKCKLTLNRRECIRLIPKRFCKYSDLGCPNMAQFECSCVEDGYVCSEHLRVLHSHRAADACSPDYLGKPVESVEFCQSCKKFIAQYLVSSIQLKVCINCSRRHGDCVIIIGNNPDWKTVINQFESLKQTFETEQANLEALSKQHRANFSAEQDKFNFELRKLQEALDELKTRWEDRKVKLATVKQDLANQLAYAKKIYPRFEGSDAIFKSILLAVKDDRLFVEDGSQAFISLFASFRDKVTPKNFDSKPGVAECVSLDSEGQNLPHFSLLPTEPPQVMDLSNGLQP